MVIFYSYVSLPEGIPSDVFHFRLPDVFLFMKRIFHSLEPHPIQKGSVQEINPVAMVIWRIIALNKQIIALDSRTYPMMPMIMINS